MKSGVVVFILTSGDLQGEEMARIFVKALPRITRFLRSTGKTIYREDHERRLGRDALSMNGAVPSKW